MALWQSEKFTTENLFDFLWNSDNELGDYYLPLETNILPKIGSIVPTFTRDTIGTVIDFEGVVHDCQIDEARFQGARRVENLLDDSEDFSTENWIKTRCYTDGPNKIIATGVSDPFFYQRIDFNRDVSAEQFIMSVDLYTDENQNKTINLYALFYNSVGGFIASQNEQKTLTTINERYQLIINPPANTYEIIFRVDLDNNALATDYIYVNKFQAEKVSGSQTEASEYVSKGVSVQLGSEIVSNGTFDDDSNWVTTGESEINSGSGRLYSSTGDLSIIGQNLSLVEGKSYLLEFDIIGTPSGAMKIGSVYGGTDIIGSLSGAGSYSFLFESTGNYISFTRTSGACDIRIDNVSVKEEYYHGAGVDGVKYFNTDRDGNLLTDIKGYLNEPESTNLCTYSEEFDNAAWVKINSSITADKFVESSALSVERYISNFSAISGTTYSISILAKSAGDNRYLILRGAGLGTNYPIFDLENGTVINAGTQWHSANIIELYNGWYLCKAVCTATASGLFRFGIQPTDVVGDYVYDGDGTSGVYLRGIQVEESPFPTSYIKTEATTVTRTVDSLIIDNSNRDVLPNSFCLVGTWTPLGAGSDYGLSDIRCFGSQDSRGSNNEVRSVGFSAYSYTVAGSGGYYSLLVDDINQLIENKYAFQLFQDGSDVNIKIYKDGVEKLSEIETQILEHSNDLFELGSWAGVAFASMIKDIKIYAKELTASQSKRITT